MTTQSLPSNAPQSEYQTRFDRFRSDAEVLSRQDNRLAFWRFVSFLAGVAACWPALFTHQAPPWLPAPFAAVFIALWIIHERVGQRLTQAARARDYYQRALERLAGKWAGKGDDGARFLDPRHPYAIDLDIFGRSSLFELICAARTRMGEETLAQWLRGGEDATSIAERREAVQELSRHVDLRETFALLGDSTKKPPLQHLIDWSRTPQVPHLARLRLIASILTGAAAVSFIYAAAGGSKWPLFCLLALEGIFRRRVGGYVNRILKSIGRPSSSLQTLSDILIHLESQSFDSALLRRMQEQLRTGEQSTRRQVEHLQTLISYLSIRSNIFFAAPAALLLWTTHCAFAIERWRLSSGARVHVWMEAVGQFEALLSLSGYAYEHPDDVYPEVVEGEACFEARGLAHPLLPASVAVRNDLSLGGGARLLILSGSNMSGKSTLMRAVGANAVLALCGAPVRAASLRISPMQLGASIRTQDSLEDGVSRFYAEIQRLQEIVTLSKNDGLPLLYLLDEIMHGTNSHDRLIGAEAVLRALSARGAIGMATTHDLALARIATDPALAAANVHLEDQIIDGKMSFDYHLRPGVVEKSNALELMRAVGLEV